MQGWKDSIVLLLAVACRIELYLTDLDCICYQHYHISISQTWTTLLLASLMIQAVLVTLTSHRLLIANFNWRDSLQYVTDELHVWENT